MLILCWIKKRIEEEGIRKQKEEKERIRKQKEEEERIRKQKVEEEKIRRNKELELKEFVDELGLPNSNSTQIFELLSKEHFDVETLLNTPKQELERIFKEIKIPFGIQAKIFTLIEKKKKVKKNTRFLLFKRFYVSKHLAFIWNKFKSTIAWTATTRRNIKTNKWIIFAFNRRIEKSTDFK